MDTRFCVYAHFVEGGDQPFYIGEGTLKRSRSRDNRNRHWNFKVKKHGAFIVKIIKDGLTKKQAEDLERKTIAEMRSLGVGLTNVCDGPMYDKSWLIGQPKEAHPMFGARFNAPWIEESNKRRAGKKQKPRPDLSERNKLASYKHYTRSVRCIETGEVFESGRAAEIHIGASKGKVNRSIKYGYSTKGFHFEYVEQKRKAPKAKPPKQSTHWRHSKLAVPFINVK